MTTDEIIEGTAMVVSETPVTLFHTDEPEEVVVKATRVATALADVIRGKKLFTNIQGKEYVRVEGWTLLGSMLGVFPVETWTKPLENGWEARVEARRGDQVVGAAEAMCTRDEKRWESADDYAIRSMAQTRATAKALRMPLGFVMQLAGYQATPAEEMSFAERAKAAERAPMCKQHGGMRFIPPGVSKAGKEYGAFWGCKEKACKATVSHDDWLLYLEREDTPRENEVIDLDDLPNE